MFLGEEHYIAGNWFIIHFTENEGMAFGLRFGGEWGKLMLSIFRIIAIVLIGWYLVSITRKQESKGLIFSVALVFAGAMGNMIDSAFYGMIFSDSYGRVAEVFPADGGYATFLHGKVVDMFYFPVIQTQMPAWVPFWGAKEFIFFRPVFNIADSSITVGVLYLLLFQGMIFKKKEPVTELTEAP